MITYIYDKMATITWPSFFMYHVENLCYKYYIFSFRDMHEFECGKNYVGLCENMTSINGETLLKFLRNVSFTGEWFFTGITPTLHTDSRLKRCKLLIVVKVTDQNFVTNMTGTSKYMPKVPKYNLHQLKSSLSRLHFIKFSRIVLFFK